MLTQTSACFQKKNRLTEREDFATIYAKGAYASLAGELTIKYIKTGNSCTRLGFPIGKNFSKKAVERNHARRILRAAAFQYVPLLKPGFDIIIMIKPSHEDVGFEKEVGDLKKVFIKANLLM